MNSQNPAQTEIPNLKLAKVGKGRERRRAGGAWMSGGRVVGGQAGMGGFGASLTKGLITLLASAAISAGAWQYGKMMSAKNAAQAPAHQKMFAAKDAAPKYADTANVIKADNSIPNSLGYVSGSVDGLTPEERARKAAADEAARQAEEDAKKKAEADASKSASAAPANAAAVDPKALAEAMTPKADLPNGKFGKLASSFGGGLSGGAGLSGGISRNFAGGSDLLQKGQNGTLSSAHAGAKPTLASVPHASAPNSKAKGFAKRQLDNAFTQSRQAMAASRGETSAASAAAPFDNNPGAGNVISGPGTGNATQPASGGTSANPTTNPGGPVGSGYTPACQSNYAPDINGNCQAIASANGTQSAPYQGLIDMAKALMVITTILAVMVLLFRTFPWFAPVVAALSTIIMAIGVIEVALGAAIFAMSGDKTMGGIVMAVGALTFSSAYFPNSLVNNNAVVNLAAEALIANAVGSLAASSRSSSQLS